MQGAKQVGGWGLWRGGKASGATGPDQTWPEDDASPSYPRWKGWGPCAEVCGVQLDDLYSHVHPRIGSHLQGGRGLHQGPLLPVEPGGIPEEH